MKLSTTLANKAKELVRNSPEIEAVQLLKQAGLDEDTARNEVAQHLMEKEAAVALSAQGINYEEALELVKAAGVKIKDMPAYKPEISYEESLAEMLVKAASEVDELEKIAEQNGALRARISELETQLAERPDTEQVPEPITKMAASGAFTNEDLRALMALPSETLTKVASAQERPWSMGKSAGTAVNSLDPLAQWILS